MGASTTCRRRRLRPVEEGIILPPQRPQADTAGRIFLIFVDDLHLDFHNTGRIRQLFQKISTTLIHEGDMFGIVSTGPSSLAIDMTYDRKRLDEAIKKISGSGLKPEDVINGSEGAEGPTEVRYRAHVAFSTANEIVESLSKIQNRRKAVIYVSNGYDFNPFAVSRRGESIYNELNGTRATESEDATSLKGIDDTTRQTQQFAFADLARDLGELTRAANRANATIYTIDPRGLVGGSDIDQKVDPTEWQDYVRTSAGQLAGDGRGDGRHRRRQPERLREGAQADRRRDQRLLHARVLLVESRPHEAHAQDRGQDLTGRCGRVGALSYSVKRPGAK